MRDSDGQPRLVACCNPLSAGQGAACLPVRVVLVRMRWLARLRTRP